MSVYNPMNSGQTPSPATKPAPAASPWKAPDLQHLDTTPGPLDPSDTFNFDQGRRAANDKFQQATFDRNYGATIGQQNLTNAIHAAGRSATQGVANARDSFGGQGLAFSPITMGGAIRGLAQQKADDISAAQTDSANKLTALDQMVNQARLEKEQAMATIATQEAAARSNTPNLTSIFDSIGA